MKIIVTVNGGVVQDVAGVPPGCVVEVHDYDVEDEDEGPNVDAKGDKYVCREWLAKGDCLPELSREQLEALVTEVRDALYLENGEVNPDREWDADTCQEVADVLDRFGLRPAAIDIINLNAD